MDTRKTSSEEEIPPFSARALTDFDDIGTNQANLSLAPLWTNDKPEIPKQGMKFNTEEREEEEGSAFQRLKWYVEPRNYPNVDHLELSDTLELKNYSETNRLQQLELLSTDNIAIENRAPNSASRWRLLGPGNFSGRVNSIAVDPNNNQKIFVCTSSGGVWCSTNGGSSWVERNVGLGSNFTGYVTIDPKNSNIVYLATGDADINRPGAGLFKSVNGGATFFQTSLRNIRWASKIIISPQDSKIIYVATDRGVYKSIDSGVNWDLILNEGQVNDLTIAPAWPRVIFAGVRNKGVYRTLNHGSSWSKQNVGPNNPFGRVRLSTCDNSPHFTFASFDKGGKVELYKTSNWGTSWTKIDNVPDAGWGQLWYNHYVSVNPNNPNIIYTGQGTIYRTTNGGSTWREINKPITNQYSYIHVDHHCLTYDPNNPTIIYCGCDGGIYRSRFGGNYWEYIGASIPCSEFYAMGNATIHPYLLGGGTQDNGTWITDGNYNRWRHILGGDGFYLKIDPRNSDIIYAEWQRLGLNRSDNGGDNFRGKRNGIVEGDLMPWMGRIEMDQSNPNILYVGTDRIYKTTNRMDNWTRLTCGDNFSLISKLKGSGGSIEIDGASSAASKLGLNGSVQGTDNNNGDPVSFARMISSLRAPFNLAHGDVLRLKVDGGSFISVTFLSSQFANIRAAQAWEVAKVIGDSINKLITGASAGTIFSAIRVAPSNSNVLYAASANQIWRSLNGGITWRSIRKAPLPNRWITDIDIAADNYNQVTICYSGSGTNHVYYTNNGGSSWESRSNGLPDSSTNSILVDPSRSSKVYVGTDVGVFHSTNSGHTWQSFSHGLPKVVISDLQMHKNTGKLRIATYGRGIWERTVNEISVNLSGVRTANQSSGNMDHFRYGQDALALVIDIAATQELIDLNLTYDAYFQVVDPRTNKVIKNIVNRNSAFTLGRYFWISRGNNWGPNASDYTTPQKWGLSRGTYIFRAAIAVRNSDSFAVSSDKWFKVF